MSETTTISLSPDVLFQEIGGETVLLNLTTDQYITLDAIGSRIWQFLVEKADRDTLISGITTEYDVSEEAFEQDLDTFLKELEAQRVLELG